MTQKLAEWKEEYSVGVVEIDNQHKQLVESINQLETCMSEGKVKEDLMKILNELINFSLVHFSTEEKYFKEFNYVNTEEHIAIHNDFKNKVSDLYQKAKDNKLEISFELIDFLEDWLLEHLKEEDQKYVECFKNNGLK